MAQKFNYKIRNKITGYFYKSSTKATWQRKIAVIHYLNSLKNQLDTPNEYRTTTFDDIEVLIFPLDDAIVQSGTDFLNDNQPEIDEKLRKKEERELREKEERELRHIRDLETKLENTRKELEKLKNRKDEQF